MTRHELAEAISEHLRRSGGRSGQHAPVDAKHVGRWERGEVLWPTTRYRAALRAVLNVATDTELGFRRPSRVTVDDVDRKAFLKTAMGVGAGLALSSAAATGSDSDLAVALAGPTAYYRRMESSIPSGQLAPAVEAHLTLTCQVVHCRLRTSDGFRVLSELAGLAAWIAADRGDRALARRRYGQAIQHAAHTRHPTLAAYMTASLGHFATESGDGARGLALLDKAAAQLDLGAPDAPQAWMSSLHALAHAKLGRRDQALAALRRAEKLAERSAGEPRWPWVFEFDALKATRYRADALRSLGDLRAASSDYAAATPAVMAAKPHALVQIEHAGVLARMGDVAQGCQLAVDALSVGRTYGSERITARVREFRGSLPGKTVEARDLDGALASLYDDGEA